MKKSYFFSLLFFSILLFARPLSGQVKLNLKQKINQEANKRANKKANEAVNEGFNKAEEGLEGLIKKDDKNDPAADQKSNAAAPGGTGNNVSPNQTQSNTAGNQSNSPSLSWAKYDFVPGDKIIFEDNHLGEENGEFPSRWDLYDGTVENAVFGDENVIMFRGGSPNIVPYLKNPKIDYLPDVFTIEFDLFLPSNSFTVYFFDRKNQATQRGHNYLNIIGEEMSLHPASSKIPEGKSIRNKWAHIAIAYTDGKMKCYINETRLINIPHLDFDPTGVSLYASSANDNNLFYIKNFRIAEGGVKYYDRFLQDGKIVSNGIRFDVGKATLRPESMGVLNEIYMMLNDHPDVAVSVEGHTDSDGDDNLNLKLSEDRAETVMKQLVSMGIPAGRLTSKGFGESRPINSNDTPEGKASNRRVEFVKNSGNGSQNSSASTVSQANGNLQASNNSSDYQTVTIGTQVWMQKNLDINTFRNGDPIPQVKTAEEWQNMKFDKKAAWCYYNFSASGEGTSGKLYNWFAVNDPRGLAPEGWRIPTQEDWDILRKKLAIGVAGEKMKSKSGWNGKNGTNTSGYNGLPGGYCDYNGEFSSLDSQAYWWGSNDDGTPWSPSIYLSAEDNSMHKHQMSKGSGLFVRCIR